MVVKWVIEARSGSSGERREFMLEILELRIKISILVFSLTFSREARCCSLSWLQVWAIRRVKGVGGSTQERGY